MKCKNYNEAWAIAKAMTNGDCTLDAQSTSVAGYKVYRSESEFYTYICDLGDRLEVNLANGHTVNLWIEPEAEKATEPERPEMFKSISNLQVINAAYMFILEKWAKEEERIEEATSENRETPIAKSRARKYYAQMQELHDEILRLEKEAE